MREASGAPARPPLVLGADDSDLTALLGRLAGDGPVSVLGGTMSRNVHLVDAGLVLRVHAPFVSAARVRAERRLRHLLLDAGLGAAPPRLLDGRELVRVAGRVAEVEEYVPHRVPGPGADAYRARFETVARIHRALEGASVPRPVVSTYGPPGTLRRHLDLLSRRALDAASRDQVGVMASALRALERIWVPASELPLALLHGDPRLENLPTGPDGKPVVLDLGFAARRPRVHDLAHASAWMLLGPDDAGTVDADGVARVRGCVRAYEGVAGPLSDLERRAFDGYLAGTCLYQGTVAAHLPDPDAHLARPGVRALLEISRTVTAHPGTVA